MKNCYHMRPAIAVLVAALLLSHEDGRAQFGTQLLLDTANMGGQIQTATTATNGDALFVSRPSSGICAIRRHGADGSSIWSKTYTAPSNSLPLLSFQSDGNGGFFAAKKVDEWWIMGAGNGAMPDTSRFDFDLALIDGDGALQWVRTIRYQRIQHSINWMFLSSVRAIRTNSGEVAVVVSISTGMGKAILLLRLSPDGSQLLHARQFGMAGSLNPSLGSMYSMPSLLAIGNNDVLLSGSAQLSNYLHVPFVARFDAQGELLWSRTVAYAAQPIDQPTIGTGIAPNGDVLIHARATTPIGNLLVHRLSPSGDWIRSDLYSTSDFSDPSYLMPHPTNGGHVLASSSGNVVLLGADGSLVGRYKHFPSNFALQSYHPAFHHADAIANTIHLTGVFIGQHQIFGTIGRWPLMERFDLTLPLEGCNVTDQPLDHYPVPANLITAAPIPSVVAMDVIGGASLSTASWSAVDIPGLNPIELCEFIDELGVGVQEAAHSGSPPLLSANAVMALQGIEVATPGAGTVELRDALGRMVAVHDVPKACAIVLEAPSTPGHYVLTWRSGNGHAQRSTRLMVQ